MESSLDTINTASNARAVVVHLRIVLKTVSCSVFEHHAPSSYTIQDAPDMAEGFENLRQIQIKTTNKIINTKLGAIYIAPLYDDFWQIQYTIGGSFANIVPSACGCFQMLYDKNHVNIKLGRGCDFTCWPMSLYVLGFMFAHIHTH